jgi:hypothetical protein
MKNADDRLFLMFAIEEVCKGISRLKKNTQQWSGWSSYWRRNNTSRNRSCSFVTLKLAGGETVRASETNKESPTPPYGTSLDFKIWARPGSRLSKPEGFARLVEVDRASPLERCTPHLKDPRKPLICKLCLHKVLHCT